MARMPAYWTNKKYWPSVQAVSQLSLSQAPRGFGAPYHGFLTFLVPSNCLKIAKLSRLDFSKITDHVTNWCCFFIGRDRYFILHKGCLYYYNRPEATNTAGKFSLGGYRY